MTDPKKLIAQSDGLELALLRAGRDDEAPDGAPRRAAIALGLAVGATATTTATTATAAASATKAVSFGVTPLLLKALGVVVVTSVVAAGVVHVAAAPGPRSVEVAPPGGARAPSDTGRTAQSTTKPAAVLPPPTPVIDAPATGAGRAPSSPATSARGASSDPTARRAGAARLDDSVTAPKAPGHAMGDELAWLDLARQALDRGDPGEALRRLDMHDSSFGDGAFGLESSVLRVEALDAQGERARALQLGERVLAAHPDEPESRHLRSIVNRIRAATTNP